MTINATYIKSYAWMSQASYLDYSGVPTNTSGSSLQNLLINNPTAQDKRLATAQASTFTSVADGYSFIAQQSNTANGTSVTVFKSNAASDGFYTIAIRGTEEGVQLSTDLLQDLFGVVLAGKAKVQLIEAFRYYKQLTTPGGQAVVYSEAEKSALASVLLSGTTLTGQLETIGAALVALNAMIANDKGLGAPGQTLIPSGAKINFTGHSLGGHVAYLLADLVSATASGRRTVGDVVTYNAPGENALIYEVQNWLGIDTSTQAGNIGGKYLAIYGEGGLNVTAGLGQIIGTRKPAYIEAEGQVSFNNHSIVKLSDSLAFYDLLHRLAPDISDNTIRNLLNATSYQHADTLETLAGNLLLLLGLGGTIQTGDRNSYYNALDVIQASAVFQTLVGNVQIAISNTTGTDAKTDFGTLLTLYYGLPFVLEGQGLDNLWQTAHTDLYAQWQTDQNLPANDAKGVRHFSDEWLKDRARYVGALTEANTTDSNRAASFDQDTWIVTDKALNRTLTLSPIGASDTDPNGNSTGGSNNSAQVNQLYFGDDAGDAVTAGDGDDRLYGGDGADQLNGGQGNDYLEGNAGNDILLGGAGRDMIIGGDGDDTLTGGQGNDTLKGGAGSDSYIFKSGDGWDWIIDSDGQGSVTYDDAVLSGGTYIAPNVWQSKDPTGKTITYNLYNDTENGQAIKMLSIQGAGGGLLIKGWQSGQLGISLSDGTAPTDVPSASPNAGTIKTAWYDHDHTVVDARNFGVGAFSAVGDFGEVYGSGRLTGNDNANYLFDNNAAGTDDELYGMDGKDTLIAMAGNDKLFGGAGDDALSSGGGNDVLDGGSGSDVLSGGIGDDILSGGDDADYLFGGGGYVATRADWSMTPEESNNFTGYSDLEGDGRDVLHGGAGNDYLWGGEGDDELFAEADNDQVTGDSGNDFLSGGAGDDKLFGDGSESSNPESYVYPQYHGNDILDGGGGNDFLTGDGGADELYGGDGNDTLIGDANGVPNEYQGDDYLDGGNGNDVLYGYGKNDILFGGAGDDILEGDSSDNQVADHGDDYLDGEDGDDKLQGDGGDDALFGGAGNDRLFGDADNIGLDYQGDDYLDGEDGDDYLRGYAGSDQLMGGAGNDQLLGENGDDYLDGGSGDDILDAGDGDDTLIGGIGVEAMYGGQGDDVYILDSGDGAASPDGTVEAIFDTGGRDVVRFGAGITIDSVQAFAANDNSVLLIQYGDDQLAITDGSSGAIESFEFEDGPRLSYADLIGRVADTPIGGFDSAGHEYQYGGRGGDALDAELGHATLSGGRGNDVLRGSGGNNAYLYGIGDGTDQIIDASAKVDEEGNAAFNTLRFGPGITQSDIRIQVGAGALKVMVGSDHNDVVYIDGFDYSDALAENSAPAIDLFEFDDGTKLTYTQLLQKGFDIPSTDGDDMLTGTSIDDHIDGGAGNDILSGGAGNDLLSGGDGADTLYGDAGDDLLTGGEGDDILAGGAGSDLVKGGEGIDSYILSYGMGEDTIVDESSEGNIIQLGGGCDIADLDANRNGNDLFVHIGGTSEGLVLQNYYLNPQSWVVQGNDGEQRDVEQIVAATEARQQDNLAREWRDYLSQTRESLLSYELSSGGYQPMADGTFYQPWNQSYWANNVWGDVSESRSTIKSTLQYFPDYYGGSASSSVNTYTDNRWSTAPIEMFEYRVVLANEITVSDSSVIYGKGAFASSVIRRSVIGEVQWGPISWGPASESTSTTVGWIYGGPYSSQGIGTATTEETHYARSGYARGAVENVLPAGSVSASNGYFPRYVNGSLNTHLYTATVEEIHAGASANTVYGDSNTLVDGGDGNDTIIGAGFSYGGDGDDTLLYGQILVGGSGSDYMEGSYGATRYLIDPSQSGYDTIVDSGDSDENYRDWYYNSIGIEDWHLHADFGGLYTLSGYTSDSGYFTEDVLHDTSNWIGAFAAEHPEVVAYIEPLPPLPTIAADDYVALQALYDAGVVEQDSIELGAGVSPDDVTVRYLDYKNILVSWAPDSGVIIQMPEFDDPIGTGVELLKFHDGTVWNMAELERRTLPSDNDDQLYGGVFDDTIMGFAGNDYIYGDSGNDALYGGTGNDTLVGDAGNDVLYGGADDDIVEDQGGSNVIDGGDGNDSLYGDYGASFLAGGTGNDQLRIWGRSSVDAFNAGNGVDTVEVGNTLTLSLGGGITADGLSLSKDEEGIVLSTENGDRIRLMRGIEDEKVLEWPAIILQIVGADIRTYDFTAVLTAFEREIAQGGSPSNWPANHALALNTMMTSTDHVIGGELAYRYAHDGSVEGLGADEIQNALSNPDFGVVAQWVDVGVSDNMPPIVDTLIMDQLASQDAPFIFQVPLNTFSDPDVGDQLTLHATLNDGNVLPTWLQFDENTRIFSGTPDNAAVGTFEITVTAVDQAGATAEANFDLTVNNVNDAPVVAHAIEDATAVQDQVFVFTIPSGTFVDVDAGETLAYSATLSNDSPLPDWLVFDPGTGTFSGNPGNGDVGEINVKVTATDASGAAASSNFTIAVANVNDAPVISHPLADQTVSENAVFSYIVPTNTFTDADIGDSLAYTAAQANGDPLPSWLTFDAVTHTVSGTPDAGHVGGLNIRITATDAGGSIASDTFELVVVPAAETTLVGTAGDDVLMGGPGNDYLDGMEGADSIYGGDGNDTIVDSGGDDTIDGGSGDDIISDEGGSRNTLRGSDGNDRITLASGSIWAPSSNAIEGGAGDDLIKVGSALNYYLQTNTITGGSGNDRIESAGSTDIYIFNRGDGHDVIRDSGATAGGWTSGQDMLVFGQGVAAGDVTAARVGDNLVLTINDPADPTVPDQIAIENWVDSSFRIEQVVFADGTTWTAAQLTNLAMTGTEDADTLMLWDEGAFVDGKGGNDVIASGMGNATIYGGDGNDIITDSGGDNIIDGGAGDDVITDTNQDDGYGHNVLRGGDGNDTITYAPGSIWNSSSNMIEGGSGDDLIKVGSALNYYLQTNTIIGGSGDDRIEGAGSTDTYVFNRGDGHDVIRDSGATAGGWTPGQDTLVFGQGFTAGDVTAARAGNDLVLTINDPANPTVPGQIAIENWGDGSFRIEQVVFADGTAWTAAQLTDLAMTGTEGADILMLWNDGAFADGKGGNDVITSGVGNATLYGGDGNDVITDSGGDNVIDGGAGDDMITDTNQDSGYGHNVLRGGDGNDTITYAPGSIWNSSSNTIEGGAGDDLIRVSPLESSPLQTNTIAGGGGNDRIESAGSTDTYIFNRGDGRDAIRDSGATVGGMIAGGEDTLVFGQGIAVNDVTAERMDNDLVLRVKDPGNPAALDQITIENWVDSRFRIEHVMFADGSSLTMQQVDAMASISVGTEHDDTISGRPEIDILYGLTGNDSIVGVAGNDLLNGGAGNDALDAGAGNDFIVGGDGDDMIVTGTGADIIAFNGGDGKDVVASSIGADNTLSLGNGIRYADLLFAKDNNDLILQTGAGEQLTFKDWYASSNNHSVASLQMVIKGTPDYDAASTEPLNNRKVQQFDFGGLVTRFDSARAADPGLTGWDVSSSLLAFHLNGSSDTAAIGGDLAYQYAMNGDLSNMAVAPAQALLAGSDFGVASRNLQAANALQDLSPRLL